MDDNYGKLIKDICIYIYIYIKHRCTLAWLNNNDLLDFVADFTKDTDDRQLFERASIVYTVGSQMEKFSTIEKIAGCVVIQDVVFL